MHVLRGRSYPRASPFVANDEIGFVVVDEGAWYLYKIRGSNWKYRVVGTHSDAPYELASITPISAALDEDVWGARTQRQHLGSRPFSDDDDVPPQDPSFDDDPWAPVTQRLWQRPLTAVLDDDDTFSTPYTVDDESFVIARSRSRGWKLFYPSRRGASPDNSDLTQRDEDPFRPQTQRGWSFAKAFTEDDVFVPAGTAFGLDDDPAYVYRHRSAGWKLFYPSRRGGSPDNNSAVVEFGLDDDPWPVQKQAAWRHARAFLDDEVRAVRVSEDYLLYAMQSVYAPPIVGRIDDEELGASATIGVDDELLWFGRPTRAWKQSSPFLDDDAWFVEPPVVSPPEPTVQNGDSGGDDVPRRRRKSPHRGFDFQAWKGRQPDFEATVREAYESLMRGPDAAEAEEALSGHRGRSGMDWPGVYRDERAMAELLELRQRRDEEEEIIVMLLH